MFSRFRPLAFAMAVLAMFAFVGAAEAGWVTFKNDTNKTIVVQEFIIVNGKKVSGKPYKLQAGESYREFQNTPGIKNYDIYDVNNPNTPVWSNPLSCKADTQSFSVVLLQGKVLVTQVQEPKKP
jgi:hypothetical protein